MGAQRTGGAGERSDRVKFNSSVSWMTCVGKHSRWLSWWGCPSSTTFLVYTLCVIVSASSGLVLYILASIVIANLSHQLVSSVQWMLKIHGFDAIMSWTPSSYVKWIQGCRWSTWSTGMVWGSFEKVISWISSVSASGIDLEEFEHTKLFIYFSRLHFLNQS